MPEQKWIAPFLIIASAVFCLAAHHLHLRERIDRMNQKCRRLMKAYKEARAEGRARLWLLVRRKRIRQLRHRIDERNDQAAVAFQETCLRTGVCVLVLEAIAIPLLWLL
jgi:hypothetical protein